MSVLTALRKWWLTPKAYPNGARYSGGQHVLFAAVAVAAGGLLIASVIAAIRFPSVGTAAIALVLLAALGGISSPSMLIRLRRTWRRGVLIAGGWCDTKIGRR